MIFFVGIQNRYHILYVFILSNHYFRKKNKESNASITRALKVPYNYCINCKVIITK